MVEGDMVWHDDYDEEEDNGDVDVPEEFFGVILVDQTRCPSPILVYV
jgi:hypothetical protein